MKVKFSTKPLLTVLNRFSAVCGTNAVVSATEGIIIDCSENEATDTAVFIGTNLRTTLRIEFVGEIIEPGSFILPHRLLLDTIKNCGTDLVTIEANEQQATVTAKGKYRMPVIASLGFPVTDILDVDGITFRDDNLVWRIEKCLPFVSKNEMQPAMQGVNMFLAGTHGEFCGTDAHRLCVSRFVTHEDGAFNEILPAELCNLLKFATGYITIGANEKSIIASGYSNQHFIGDWKIRCTKIDQRYPMYSVVIPANNPNTLKVSKTAFILALRRVGIYSDSEAHSVDLVLTEGKEMGIQAISDNGEASENLECVYEGENMTIRFNGKLLVAALNANSADEVVMNLGHPTKAAVIEDRTDTILIMPLFVG